MSARPRVLAVADRPGWAIDSKTRALTRALADRYDVVTRYQRELVEADLAAADLILIYYWLELRQIPLDEAVLAAYRDRLVMGVCSHFELSGEMREPGLAVLRRLPRAIFVNNKLLEREVAPLVDKPVYYTPNGVDTTFFSPPARRRERIPGVLRVGWTGSLTNQGAEHRGFPNVVEPALARVPGATLVTAIREQRWRPKDEMPAFYGELDVYVCASDSEGTPNPCLEAAACGVPIVTTRVGNMLELVCDGDNGLFFDRTIDDLATKLAALRDDPAMGERLAARMLETIAGWDWRVQAEAYAKMFADVLDARRAT